jgi:hypothetical protein
VTVKKKTLKKSQKILKKIIVFGFLGLNNKNPMFKNVLKLHCLKMPIKSNVYKCHKNSMFKNAIKN